MEYCAGGDLSQLISDRKEKRIKGTFNALLDLNFVLKVFRQLLSALKELHHNDQVLTFQNFFENLPTAWVLNFEIYNF